MSTSYSKACVRRAVDDTPPQYEPPRNVCPSVLGVGKDCNAFPENTIKTLRRSTLVISIAPIDYNFPMALLFVNIDLQIKIGDDEGRMMCTVHSSSTMNAATLVGNSTLYSLNQQCLCRYKTRKVQCSSSYKVRNFSNSTTKQFALFGGKWSNTLKFEICLCNILAQFIIRTGSVYY